MKTMMPALVSLSLGAALVAGCAKDEMKETPADAAGAAKEAANEELPEGLQGLDPADLALVKAQEDCPVSGEPLGSMGAPIRKEVDGKVVFLCCKSCNKKFDADPQKYLAMVEGN